MGQEGEETHPTIWVLHSPESAPPDCWICWRCAAPGPPPRTPDGERTEDRQGLRAGLTWKVLYSWTIMILNQLWVWPRITLIIVCFLSTTGQTLLGQIRGVTWYQGEGGGFLSCCSPGQMMSLKSCQCFNVSRSGNTFWVFLFFNKSGQASLSFFPAYLCRAITGHDPYFGNHWSKSYANGFWGKKE